MVRFHLRADLLIPHDIQSDFTQILSHPHLDKAVCCFINLGTGVKRSGPRAVWMKEVCLIV